MLSKLSQCINTLEELRRLTIKIGTYVIDWSYEERTRQTISKRALMILNEWFAEQPNPRTAYYNLCKALKDKEVGMEPYILKALVPELLFPTPEKSDGKMWCLIINKTISNIFVCLTFVVDLNFPETKKIIMLSVYCWH